MTPVMFRFQLPDGTPHANAPFTVTLRKAGFLEDGDGAVTLPYVIDGMTDAEGKQVIELAPLNQPYYLVVGAENDDLDSCSFAARYRFYVPKSDTEIDLENILLTDPLISQPWDEKAVQILVQAKIDAIEAAQAAEAAAERAETAATTVDGVVEASALSAQQAIDARDASEAFAVKSLTHATESNTASLAAESAAQGIEDAVAGALDSLMLRDGASNVGAHRPDGSDANVQILIDELRRFRLSGLAQAVERSIYEKMADFATFTDFGGKGDAVAYNDQAMLNCIASGKRIIWVPEGVYRMAGSVKQPTYMSFIGPGGPEMGFGTVDGKQYMRPGFKHLLPGVTFLFDGTGTIETVNMPQRTDEYANVSYMWRVVNEGIGSQSATLQGISIAQDMDCFTAAGVSTKPATDNRALGYDTCLVIDDAARTKVRDVNRFGYFPKAGTVVSSRSGNDDPDYNTFEGGSTMGRHGIALLGSSTPATFGLSGTRCNRMGIYTLDHHGRGNMTDAERREYYAGADDWKQIYIDGDVDASSAEINGHYFDQCEIRGRNTNGMLLDHASNIVFNQCVFEFVPYNIPGSMEPRFLATENVKRGVFFRDCRNNHVSTIFHDGFIGQLRVACNISGDPLDGRSAVVHRNPAGGYTATVIGSDSNIGNASVQFTDNIVDGSSGWKLYLNAADGTLNIRHGTQTSSAMQFTTAGVRIPSTGERRLLHEVGPALAMSTGAITVTRSYHAVTGTGDLTTINGGVAGMRLLLRPTATGDVLTVKRTGNIRTPNGVDLVLTGSLSHVELVYNGNLWCVLSYSNNG